MNFIKKALIQLRAKLKVANIPVLERIMKRRKRIDPEFLTPKEIGRMTLQEVNDMPFRIYKKNQVEIDKALNEIMGEKSEPIQNNAS